MSASNVVSLFDVRSKAEGWEDTHVEFGVFDLGNDYAELRVVTGDVVTGDVQVDAVQVGEDALSRLIARATEVRDSIRRRRFG